MCMHACMHVVTKEIDGMIPLYTVEAHSCTPATQGPVVQRVKNAIHRINHYPTDSTVGFVNTYPLDSNLSDG